MADHIYDTEYAMNEFSISGELQMMDKLSEFKLKQIFDVGANIGEWTKMVLERQDEALIDAFEPMPYVFKNFLENVEPNGRVMPNPFGLSSTCEIRDMLFDSDNDRLTTPCLELNREHPRIVPLIMLSGDEYCRSRGIESIDLIKIDTEGHEFQVLRGFENMLKNQKIAMIQFEYGFANVLTKDLLIDFYKLLQPFGYHIGIQTPEGIVFREYTLVHENFMAPNYVAVHGTAPEFMEAIQVKR
jgi:FkbM family methyltransferase